MILFLFPAFALPADPGGGQIDRESSCQTVVSGVITLTITTINISSDFYNGNNLVYNGSISVAATGGLAPYTYQVGNGNINNNGYFGLLPAGTYQVLVTDAMGQTTSASVTLTAVYPTPSVFFSNVINPTSCTSSDGSFSLTGSGGTLPYLYSIDGGLTYTSNNVFTGLSTGFYQCLLKDANGMLAEISSSQLLLNNQPDNIFFNCGCCPLNLYIAGFSYSACMQDSAILGLYARGGTPPYSFSLDGINYFPGTPGNGGGYTFKNLNLGLYHGYVKDADGNIAIGTTEIVQYCSISIAFADVDASCGQPNGSLHVTASGGVSPYEYTLDGIHFQTSNVFTGLSKGTYTVGVRDATGMINLANTSLYDKCPTVSAVETGETCAGQNGTITASGANGSQPYAFSIDGVNFYTGTQNSYVFTGLDSGTYIVTLKDALGAVKTDTITVKNDCLHLSLSFQPATCGNQNGSISVIGSNGTPPYSYSLDGVNFQTGNYFGNLPAGKYTVTMKDSSGLLINATITITALPGPQMQVTTSPASCQNTNGSITLTGTGGSAPLQYSIDGGITYQSADTFGNLDAGQYIPIIRDANGCTVSDTIDLGALPLPRVFLGNDTTVCAGQTLLLNATFNNASYLWQDGFTGPQYIVNQPGLYTVKVTNICGVATDSIRVDYGNCTCRCYIPNAFSPNGDGKNDVFLPKYTCQFSHYSLQVFSRWGQLLFVTRDPSRGWDGTLGGQIQPTGVYVWEMGYEDNVTGKTIHRTGTVVLIR